MTQSPYGAEDPADGLARIRPYLRTPPPLPEPGNPEPDAAPVTGPAAAPSAAGLRPFVLTSGRVAGADPDIGLETQVTACPVSPFQPAPALSSLAPELQAIIALAAEPISVAEISARLRLHLGVTRILVGDLRAAAHLDVHVQDVEVPANADTILRVIRGLRAIS